MPEGGQGRGGQATQRPHRRRVQGTRLRNKVANRNSMGIKEPARRGYGCLGLGVRFFCDGSPFSELMLGSGCQCQPYPLERRELQKQARIRGICFAQLTLCSPGPLGWLMRTGLTEFLWPAKPANGGSSWSSCKGVSTKHRPRMQAGGCGRGEQHSTSHSGWTLPATLGQGCS